MSSLIGTAQQGDKPGDKYHCAAVTREKILPQPDAPDIESCEMAVPQSAVFLLVGAGSGSSTWCSTSGPEHLAFTDVRALSPSSMAPSSIRPVVRRHHSPMGGWHRRPLG